MSRKTVLALTLIAAFAAVAVAADVTGKWIAQVPGRDGQTREVVYTLKQDGDKLSGSMTGRQGQEVPFTDGTVSGDTLSFTVTMQMGDNVIKWEHTGKIVGDEIQFKRAGGRGEPQQFVAKRAK